MVPSRSRSVPEKTTGHTKDGGERERERDEGRREKTEKRKKEMKLIWEKAREKEKSW